MATLTAKSAKLSEGIHSLNEMEKTIACINGEIKQAYPNVKYVCIEAEARP